MTSSTETGSRARVRDPARLLWPIAGVCWAGTTALILFGGDQFASHDQIIEHSTLPWAARITVFLLIWTVMVGAMMLPTTVAMTRLLYAVSARTPHPARARGALLASYLAVWVGFGLVALAGDSGVHAMVDNWPWLNAHSGLVLAALLALAGAVQFSPVKDRCLTACRDPLSVLWQHYRPGVGAWRLGWHHALNCLGCCWALMLLMFGVGVGSLAWMAVLTAVMAAEKSTRWGKRLVVPAGVALLLYAVAEVLAVAGVQPFYPLLATHYS